MNKPDTDYSTFLDDMRPEEKKLSKERLAEIYDAWIKDQKDPHSPSHLKGGDGSVEFKWTYDCEEYFDLMSRDFVKELLDAVTWLDNERDFLYAELMGQEHRLGTLLEMRERENAKLKEKIGTLFETIKHGDETHQAWLKKVINDHFEIKEAV